MKLKFYTNPKSPSDQIIINKAHNLALRKNFVDKFKIEKHQRFEIAIDEDEKAPIVNFYLVLTKNDNLEGLLVSYINRQYHIGFKGVCHKFNIKPPVRCDYTQFTEGDYTGIKITILPNEQKK